jgi:hypothetical protein
MILIFYDNIRRTNANVSCLDLTLNLSSPISWEDTLEFPHRMLMVLIKVALLMMDNNKK